MPGILGSQECSVAQKLHLQQSNQSDLDVEQVWYEGLRESSVAHNRPKKSPGGITKKKLFASKCILSATIGFPTA